MRIVCEDVDRDESDRLCKMKKVRKREGWRNERIKTKLFEKLTEI